MDQTPEAPLTPREKIAAGRVKGKLLREERLAREAQKGYFRVTFLSAATWAATLQPLLAKGSAAPAAFILMDKIQLAGGNREGALESLKNRPSNLAGPAANR